MSKMSYTEKRERECNEKIVDYFGEIEAGDILERTRYKKTLQMKYTVRLHAICKDKVP